ncbi:MAG: 30S ribosomal protein S8 [Deltaproteobacteria bacterium RBG_13_65_10]|nr:MAG: 30S ribosomal protein S8 [Deltaproteobacteria bacterium RBG_13_65_10]
MMTDPIADMITRIRNAIRAKFEEVAIPSSKLKVRIAEILKDEGYIDTYEFVPDNRQGTLKVRLRYVDEVPTITGLKRVSSPGRRVYVRASEIPSVLNGLGIAILSTSSGIMTDRRAREVHVGGELLCTIW